MKTRAIVSLLLLAFFAAGLYRYGKQRPTPTPPARISLDVPVAIARVERRTITPHISYVGTIEPSHDVQVVAEAQGETRAVFVNVGDEIRRGTVLVQIDDELARSAQAAAELSYERSRRDLERHENLYQENSISALQLDAARFADKSAENALDIARRKLRDTRIVSPIAGTVNLRMVGLGTMVSPGMVIANIVDTAVLRVVIQAGEADAFRIHAGAAAEVRTDVYPTEVFAGKVENIAVKADDAHTYRVEIGVPNRADHALRAGMFAEVSFVSLAPREALVVPREAVPGSTKDASVFVVTGDLAHLRPVVTGLDTSELLEIVTGLSEGEIVVVSGQNNLRDGARVRVIQ